MPDPIANGPVQVPRDDMLRSLGLETGTEEADRPDSHTSGPGVSGGNLRGGGKVGRNDPWPCGSGKKYKKCCGK